MVLGNAEMQEREGSGPNTGPNLIPDWQPTPQAPPGPISAEHINSLRQLGLPVPLTAEGQLQAQQMLGLMGPANSTARFLSEYTTGATWTPALIDGQYGFQFSANPFASLTRLFGMGAGIPGTSLAGKLGPDIEGPFLTAEQISNYEAAVSKGQGGDAEGFFRMGSSSPSGGSTKRQLTKEELDQIKEQTETLRRSRQLIEQAVSQQNLATPHIFNALGFNVQQDASGAITGMTPRKDGAFASMTGGLDTDTEGFQASNFAHRPLQVIQNLAFRRAADAFRGDTSNAALEQSLEDSRQGLENQLVARYGADFLGSSGGQNAFAAMEADIAAARAQQQQQDIGFFSSLGSQATGQIEALRSSALQRDISAFQTDLGGRQAQLGLALQQQAAPFSLAMQALGPLSAASSAPLAFAAPVSNVAAGFSGPLDALISARGTTIQGAAGQPSTGQGLGATIGGLAGTAIGAYYGGPQGAAIGSSTGATTGGFFGGLF